MEESTLYKAGFWIRLGAGVLDSLIISIPLVIIAGVLTGNFDTDEPIAKLLSALYSILLPVYWYGRTIGKRICGIRIRKYDLVLFHKTRILYICITGTCLLFVAKPV
ncbi:RDD family protein [Paenibacillus xylanexedens]|uniref:RDD family protein n=1 Tax=Paenibacillus xylanexedens TaxID=528191 RepID=UPI003CFDFA11